MHHLQQTSMILTMLINYNLLIFEYIIDILKCNIKVLQNIHI